VTRRELLYFAAAASALKAAPPKTDIGIASTSYMTAWRPRDTIEFLEHCHAIGASGIQSNLSSTDPVYLNRLRTKAEEYGMYIEVMVPLPKNGDTSAFEHTLAGAKSVNAVAMRTGALSGRRYETFKSLSQWNEFKSQSLAAIEAALPLVEKTRIPLGIENHKDWTVAEAAALMKKYSSEYLGMTLDFGNNIALLDDPMAILELAPYAVVTHLKDMAVEPYEQGFLLSEVPLGAGILDLHKIVAAIRASRPRARMTLEMITRDPLEVPCLTESYWITFPDRNGVFLARTMSMVRQNSKGRLPRMTAAKDAQLRQEEENVLASLFWARNQLTA
jgi:sugar phosphate isomerase/epimerase